MKKILFFAATAAFLAACSSDDLTVQEQPQQVQAEPGAVGFDAYLYRATTRAGMQGPTTIEALKGTSLAKGPGFAVFAYYTNNNEYDGQTLPNFMYNQNVLAEFDGGGTFDYWKYTPVMYWPNEYGQNAISDDNDKVTFFAYAPYVPVVPSTGKLADVSDGKDQWGIVQISRNTATGDPWVKYIASFDGSKQVDLCWGVNSTPSWNTVNAGVQTFTTDFPWLNVERPREAKTQETATDASKVKFQFKHALSQLNVTVDTYADKDDGVKEVADGSRVFVRSITFTGFTMKGMLNLNNTEAGKPLWIDFNGNGDLESGQEIVVTDGRRDGKEGTAGGALPNEKGVGLNPQIVETDLAYNYTANEWAAGNYDDAAVNNVPYGVDNTPRNVFRKWQDTPAKYIAMGADDPIYVIPTGEDVQVTIVYDVETIDSQLPVYLADAKTTGSNIENKITKTVNFGKLGMEAGKKYTIKLHLGMNSVKIDAAVDDWTEQTPMDVYLPSNKPQFAAATGASYDYTLDGATTSLVFDMYGFNGGEALTYNYAGGTPIAMTAITENTAANQADAQGKATANIKITANGTVKNQFGKVTWTGTSGKQVELNLTQKAKPLGLTLTGMANTTTDITLAGGGADGQWSSVASADDVIVYRNGVKLTTKLSGTAAAGEIVFSTAGKLTVASTEPITLGDVFTITIKSGDAPAETITYEAS